jgi:hypothetical protein
MTLEPWSCHREGDDRVPSVPAKGDPMDLPNPVEIVTVAIGQLGRISPDNPKGTRKAAERAPLLTKKDSVTSSKRGRSRKMISINKDEDFKDF